MSWHVRVSCDSQAVVSMFPDPQLKGQYHAQSVVSFLITLWTIVLIVCAAIEKFFQETLGSSRESGSLLADEAPNPTSSHGKPKWGDLLRNNIENLLPLFISVCGLQITTLYLFGMSSYKGVLAASVSLEYIFLACRHAIGFMKGITLCRAIGFAGSTLTVLALAWMNVGNTFGGRSSGLGGDFFQAGVVAVCVAVLITKYYLISVRAAMGRLRSDDAALIERLQRITRNEVESLCVLAGILTIWNGVVLMYFQQAAFHPWDIASSMFGFASFFLVYTLARVSFVICYYLGKQPFRTISFMVGILCLLVMGFWSLSLLIDRIRFLEKLLEMFAPFLSMQMCTGVVTFLEVFRSVCVGFATGFVRTSVEKTSSNPEDRAYIERGDLPVDSQGTGEADLPALPSEDSKSGVLQQVHVMDNTLQVVFFFALYTLMFGNQVDYEAPSGTNGAIAFISLFFIFRVMYLVAAAVMVHGQTLTAFAKMGLTFASLLPLVVMMLWGFIAGEIAIVNMQNFTATSAASNPPVSIRLA